MNSYEELREKKKNVSILITTCWRLSKHNFTAPKMSDYLILDWGEWLTQTEQLIDRRLKKEKIIYHYKLLTFSIKTMFFTLASFLPLTWQET